MGKRVYELARDLGVDSKAILTRLRESGGPVLKDHLAPLSKEQEDLIRKLFETPKPGDVQVKKMEGGRVVRRRAGGAPVAVSEAAPVVAPPEAPTPVVPEIPAPVEKAPVEKAPVEKTPVEETPVEKTPVEETPVEDAPISPVAPEPVVESEPVPVPAPEPVSPPVEPVVPVVQEPAPVAMPQPPVSPPAVEAQKARPAPPEKPSATSIKAMAEAPDRKGKLKRLIYDRRRDVISLRDLALSSGDSDAEPVEARPAMRRKKAVQRRGKPQKTMLTVPKEQKRVIRIEGEVIQVGELARHMGVKAGDIVRKLMELGVMASITQTIDADTAAILASDLGFTIEKVGFDPTVYLKEKPDRPEDLQPRPPVVTIMGHVDHGKTTLLDHIRKTHVAEGEAGGITQHIGAYKVSLPAGDIVFLDTPGHEAFTAMRARGAKVTDVVVLVVAADDGVKAQTLEAIAHAKAGGAPIIVAVNKVDKPEARPERVRRELTEQGLAPEEWGGQTIFCEISAKQGRGVDNLLEMILLQAQMLELKANPDKPGRGVVIESELDRQVGPLATVLVQSGTVRVGDMAVAGLAHGRIRLMVDKQGVQMKAAGPSTPVRVAGLDMVPNAGDVFVVLPDEKRARDVAEWQLEQLKRARAAKTASRVSLEDLHAMVQAGSVKDLKIILRTDVQGSLGPLTDSISKLKHPEISVKLIHSAVGNITESDVNLAIASDAIIIGFNVSVDPKAAALADQERVDIKRYSVIYDVMDDLKKAMEGLLTPKQVAKLSARAEVRQIFHISRIGRIAGCVMLSGTGKRSATVHVIRGKEKVFEGKIASLKHLKDDVREVKQGLEFGVSLEGFEGIEAGDHLEFYEFETVRESL